MALRWVETDDNQGIPVTTAFVGRELKFYKLQYWQKNRRFSEAAGLDYSDDGEWLDVEITEV